MSSIDKGVEKVVSNYRTNVVVTNRNGQIVGTVNGEVIFSINDRYGYINESETNIVKNAVERYEDRQREIERRAEERRLYEEQLRIARERAEAEERRRLEEERQAAINAARVSVNNKKNQLLQSKNNDLSSISNLNNYSATIQRKITTMIASSRHIDLSILLSNYNQIVTNIKNAVTQVNIDYSNVLNEITTVEKQISNTLTTENAKELNKRINKIKTNGSAKIPSRYELEELNKLTDSIHEMIKTVMPALQLLEKYVNETGEIGVVANHVLSTIKESKIQNIEDVKQVCKFLENGASNIKSTLELSEIGKHTEEIKRFEGVISACNEIITYTSVGTYEAKNFRNEIEKMSEELIRSYTELSEDENASLSSNRIFTIIERIKQIQLSDLADELTLNELKSFAAEIVKIKEDNLINAIYLNEYNELKEKILNYGVDYTTIPAFNLTSFKEVKQELIDMLSNAKVEARKTNLYTTYLNSNAVMEEMGFELFSKIGDEEGYITEALFTKPGYDGVLWQIVVLSDGSFSRRIIGVNKGDTQTDENYLIQVAKEMDENNEPLEFMRRYKEKTGEEIRVSSAVEYNSENAIDKIREHGYHYLEGNGVQLYNEQVAGDPKVTSRVKASATNVFQVKVTPENRVDSSANALQNAQARSMAIDNEN